MAITEATLLNAGTHAGLYNLDAVSVARTTARRDRLSVIDTLSREQRLPRTALYQAVAQQRNLPFLPLAKLHTDKELLARLPDNLLLRRLVLPVRDAQQRLLLAMADPDDQVAIDTVKRVLNETFAIVQSEPVSITSTLKCELNLPSSEEQDPVQLFDELMKEAYVCNASDIHLKPQKAGLKASLRVDGRLIPYPKLLNKDEANLLINRVKVLSSLDISEQRIPQDGGFSYAISDWALPPQDLRVATLPSRWGERITLRILGQESGALALDQLDLHPQVLERFRDVLTYPNGMVLITGPTGSGKSTTLYAALREIDRTELNVLTVEDPIEQLLEDITQVQVGVKISFSQALRSFLRHDPDIILVGEIRDQDTAETAMKASMTGHLVLSTLHTNNATSAVSRMYNLKCEHFMIATTLRLVLAQRLARRLCRLCRQPASTPPPLEFDALQGAQLYEAKGCPACLGTGYKGRIGLHEMFFIDAEISQLIAAGANDETLRNAAKQQLYTLWQDALYKVAKGYTSLEEVLPFKELVTPQQPSANSPLEVPGGVNP